MTRNRAGRFTGELQARITLARAISADFANEVKTVRKVPYAVWATRMRIALDGLLRALDESTAPLLDGGAYISGPDLMVILAALRDAAEYRCNHPGDSDRVSIAAYRGMSRTLGDDR